MACIIHTMHHRTTLSYTRYIPIIRQPGKFQLARKPREETDFSPSRRRGLCRKIVQTVGRVKQRRQASSGTELAGLARFSRCEKICRGGARRRSSECPHCVRTATRHWQTVPGNMPRKTGYQAVFPEGKASLCGLIIVWPTVRNAPPRTERELQHSLGRRQPLHQTTPQQVASPGIETHHLPMERNHGDRDGYFFAYYRCPRHCV